VGDNHHLIKVGELNGNSLTNFPKKERHGQIKTLERDGARRRGTFIINVEKNSEKLPSFPTGKREEPIKIPYTAGETVGTRKNIEHLERKKE